MRAADAFVPLDVWLRGTVAEPPPAAVAPAPVLADPRACGACGDVEARRAEALRDLRLFRARLADALDTATGVLVRELAYAVVGRELHLAPADIAALASRIVGEHPAATPAGLRCAPDDEHALRVGLGDEPALPIIVDPALEPGDAIVAFSGGWIDARLGVRLEAVLEAWA